MGIEERLIRYCRIDTPSDPYSKTSPSTAKQFALADLLKEELPAKKTIVASGNAIQRIAVLKHILEEMFGLPVLISGASEEAALGAALFGAAAAGILQSEHEFEDFIHYKDAE